MNAKPVDCDVAVIGAGFAGLYAIYKLRALGFRVQGFEKGSDVGGVWYWNRYPGARCDCESYYYSYSFSKQLQDEWKWSLHYSEQPEILSYLSHVAERFDLKSNIKFDTAVEGAVFDEGAARWTITTSHAETVTANYIVSAAGCLSEILKPNISGLESFAGNTYYTAAWPKKGVDFQGLRVGVIGTGASAVQAIPRIAKEARHLTVFQRTANWVIPVWNAPMKPEFTAWVKENYAEIRRRCLASGGGVPFDVSHTPVGELSPEERQATLEKAWSVGGTRFFAQSFSDLLVNEEANHAAAAFVARYIRSIVKDPKVAELLIPDDHPIGTKRPPMDDDYYATFNRDNVTLVDVRSAPIVAIEGHTLRTKVGDYPLDALVLATGFDAITGPLLSIDIRGRDGRRLRDRWKDGAHTFLGLSIAGFPNLFTITGPMSPSVLANMPTAIEQHVDWIADCLAYMREHNLDVIEASESAQEEWVAHTRDVANGTLYPKANSWYLGSNVPGKPRQFGVYLGGFSNYREKCNTIASKGYEGFVLKNVPAH
jgi:cation diffusion facilitator CzcD-associated flavoprotein CzcO